jgi:hypothetical protein
VGVWASGGGRVSVGWYGAESGVTVGLGSAVAIRARFSLRPRIEQDARRKQNPNAGRDLPGKEVETVEGDIIDSSHRRIQESLKNPARP